MALTNTTLAAAVAFNDVTIRLTSATGFADGQLIRVNNEFMAQAGAANGVVVTVRRGLDGTAVSAHGILSDVVTGLLSDFPAPPAGMPVMVPPTIVPGRNSIGVDTTFAAADFPKGDLSYVITKATACAITLGQPSKAQNGLRITFRSATAAAHTVTLTAGFYGDTTSSDIATFAAKIGASMTIEANAGTWGVIALANVTIA
jgi:hypothetical protein